VEQGKETKLELRRERMEMMLKILFKCIHGFLLLAIVLSVSNEDAKGQDMNEQYEAVLYSLGSVPVSKLEKKYWHDESGHAAYLKNQRVDVNGWLLPFWAKSDAFLTDSEKERFGIPKAPLTFEGYVGLLDVDRYAESQNKRLYAIMAFVLENMLAEGIEFQNTEPIKKVYTAGIGLEERALKLLKGRLNSDEVMMLYNTHKDARLLDVFPVPRPQESDYIAFLREVSEAQSAKGWTAFRQLYVMDRASYKAPFRDLLILKARKSDSWTDRMKMYEAIVDIGDETSLGALQSALMEDSVTEVRESIIYSILAKDMWSRELVKSVIQLAHGQGREHDTVTHSRMIDQWRYNLRSFLAWAGDNEHCDAQTKADISRSLKLLMN